MAFYTMSRHSFLVFISLVLYIYIPKSIASPQVPEAYVYALCPDMTTVAPSSEYQTNINTVLSYFSTKPSHKTRFFNTTAGSGANKVYGLFFCRLDVTDAACRQCVSLATNALSTRCPGKKESVVWYFDQCCVRYSNGSSLGTMHDAPMIPMWNRQNSLDIWNVTNNMTGFMQVLLKTMEDATVKASSGPLEKKFATRESKFVGNLSKMNTIYTLVECTPDISLRDCKRCLQMTIGNTTELCNLRAGCTVMCPNCNLRYDIYPFYGDAAGIYPGPSSPSLGEGTNDKSVRRRRVREGTISAAALIVLLLFGVLIFVLKRKSKDGSADLNDMEAAESLKFDFSTIRSATNNFSDCNKLGEGGFGEVFKGRLENGQEVAVKRLSRNSKQGIAEFKTEVHLVAGLQHRNLVRLLGFCLATDEKLLVYEYLSNSSLDHILFDPKKCASLDWETRFKIIVGIAKGLLYLHEDSRLKIIHRDLKSSNILLDKDMNPKISDFGMARLFGQDEMQGNTSKIAGTFGYMAPEYVLAGHYSVKSDVYSFGIIILEIVSGQMNNFFRQEDEELLLDKAWSHWDEGLGIKLVDSKLEGKFSVEEAARCIHIALLCIQEDASKRPSMAIVVAALSGDSVILPMPTAPHFFIAGKCHELLDSGIYKSSSGFTGTSAVSVLGPR
ncbi:cysteine-rich receptor-like protein kinase 25 [Silene latifolia]|uniref:cysteine-rich receptor-like protein kinase 25 n=1 Tax=Silene latifolia TaxID=37657 RepID=UPI003D7733ED